MSVDKAARRDLTTVLFLDDWMLSRSSHMVRRPGKPKWVPEGTLEDGLCEGTWNRPSIFRAPDKGIWRAVYSGVRYVQGRRCPLGMMVAESEDGIHWVKPDLSRRVEIPDRRAPNQVYQAMSGGPAFYDEREVDDERRLKYLYADHLGPPEKRLIYLTSPDGITWNESGVWGTRQLDAPISIFYNSHRQKYVISNRPVWVDRRVAFIETADFQSYSEPELVLSPSPQDPPLAQFYGLTVFPYEGMYIGLLLLMHTEPDELSKGGGYAEGSLAYSYNGWSFNRASYDSFIPRNDRSEQGGGSVYPSSMVVDELSHQIRIYSGSSRATHFQTQEPLDAAIVLHTLRQDGFAYLEPASVKGTAVTRRIRLTGPRIYLNVRAPYGCVRVEILDYDGKPFDGFSLADSIPFTGDEVYHEPRWRTTRTLSSLVGRLAHIAVEVTNGELYAIRGDLEVMYGVPSDIVRHSDPSSQT